MVGTLREEMDRLAQMSVEQTEKDEASFQKLYMLMPDDSVMVALLDVGPGRNIAFAARMLVYENEPSIAVLETEGWTVRWDIPRDDPIWGKVARGEVAPADLPDEQRGESLILYGENAEGEVICQLWKILPGPDGTRRVEPFEAEDLRFSARFTPLFVVEDLERLIDGELSLGETKRPRKEALLDAEIVDYMRKLVGQMPRDERRQILRKVVGETIFKDAPFRNIRSDTLAERKN